MPLAGTICCRTGEPARFEDCIQCAKYGAPEPCVHPFPLITSMAGNKASRDDATDTISTTTLLGCYRFDQLSEVHDYYEDPAEFSARFKGTLVHAGLEKLTENEDDVFGEVRFFKEYEGHIISGKPDLVLHEYAGDAGKGRLIDGKSAGRRKLYDGMTADDDHIRQVNIYRWLMKGGWYEEPIQSSATGLVAVRKTVDIDINSAAIWYIGDTGFQEVEVPVWPIPVVEGMISQLMEKVIGFRLAPILPSKYVTRRRTGITEEVRHWKCDRCPLREVCDTYPHEGVPHDEGNETGILASNDRGCDCGGNCTRDPLASATGETGVPAGQHDDPWGFSI